jgi:general nucleoside transport system ATP-binding protein
MEIVCKFLEVTGFAQDVTVLRNGQLIGTHKIEESSQDELGSMMLGAAPDRSVQFSRRKSPT